MVSSLIVLYVYCIPRYMYILVYIEITDNPLKGRDANWLHFVVQV